MLKMKNLMGKLMSSKARINLVDPRQIYYLIKKNCFFKLEENYNEKNFLSKNYNYVSDELKINSLYYLKINLNKDKTNLEEKDDLFEKITQFIKNKKRSFESNKDFEYNFELSFKYQSLFGEIHNREDAYINLKKLFNKRMIIWQNNKNYNPLIGVASVPGGGKTLFLQSIPFYLKCSNPNDGILPIYITFNATTPYDPEFDINPKAILNYRLLYGFISCILTDPKNYFKDGYHLSEIKKEFSTEIKTLDPYILIEKLLKYSRQKVALILIDEI